MKPSHHRRNFSRAIFTGVALTLASLAFASVQAPHPAKISALTERFAVAGQITPEQLVELKARGYTTIIALRPDGEGADQPSAAQVGAAARDNGMAFAYVPVTAGAAIPETAVAALGQALQDNPGKVLLYCRSGSRAARTWGLVEASRPGGADADAILAAVKASGQSADDLREAISKGVASRLSRP